MMRFIYTLQVVALVVVLITGCKNGEPIHPPVDETPTYNLTDFQPSQACSTCHPQQYNDWSGSMHRYSTNDPIWMMASNSLQLQTGGRLQSWCFQCHSPIAFLTKSAPLTPFQIGSLPSIVKEGVNCDFCHILRPPYTTTSQVVKYNIKPGMTKYGPIADPIATGAHESEYDPSYNRSEACRSCHDLIVNNVPVEITFREWQNSPWGAMSVECQDCHMLQYTGRAAVGGPIRNDLRRHDFIGVDVAITDFPNKPKQRELIDSLLKNSASMTINVPPTVALEDTIKVEVTVCNDKTGHNLPTSVFFNRQMWVEVTAWNDRDTAYRSGHLDANGDLMDKNSSLQPNADKDLTVFGGTLYKKGQETNVFELDSLVNNSIPPFASRTAHYNFKAPYTGVWNISVRLLFRPFGPYLFRAVGAQQYLAELPIFEMVKQETILNVQQ
ncbi:MAG TPA: multiheme c-type cytochrome [Bacteroidota bacterium]|nr:multiheme c-type cytochrome [Bacteroidota bacterium]